MRKRRFTIKKQGKKMPCFCFEEIDSTNNKAKEMLKCEKMEGEFVVLALKQTAGRGRMNRAFLSPLGKGIYLTYVCKWNGNNLGYAGCATALAVCHFIEETFGISCSIKWPNDVVVGGKKICGILPEMVTLTNGEKYLLIGIGINILTEEVDFGEIKDIATSAVLECKKEDINVKFCKNIEKALFDTGAKVAISTADMLGDFLDENGKFPQEYESRLVTIGKEVSFTSEERRRMEGTAVGIENDGALKVMSNGETFLLKWGELVEIS